MNADCEYLGFDVSRLTDAGVAEIGEMVVAVPRRELEGLLAEPASALIHPEQVFGKREYAEIKRRLRLPEKGVGFIRKFNHPESVQKLGEPDLVTRYGKKIWLLGAKTHFRVRIAKVRIEKLFGKFDYELPAQDRFGDVVIVYGDNGSGKTTILKLVFNLLSAAGGRGHRNAIRLIPFKRISVTLSNEATISASREKISDHKIKFSIRHAEKSIDWNWDPEWSGLYWKLSDAESITLSGSNVISSLGRPFGGKEKDEERFLSYLSSLDLPLFFVTSDRRIVSDTFPENRTEYLKIREFTERQSVETPEDIIAYARSVFLEAALSDAAKWISIKAVTGTNEGAESTNSVYVNLIKNLLKTQQGVTDGAAEDLTSIISSLQELSQRYRQYSEFEFTSTLQVDQIVEDLNKASKRGQLGLMRAVIDLYREGAEARLKALESIYELTRRFIDSVNHFFTSKKLTFGLTRGFVIRDSDDKVLKPDQLSSGEQHLLLLFCYTLISQEQTNVLFIDEPEISLNVKWQRNLVQALLDISRGSTQFVFATHSIELIALHRNAVAQLHTDNS